jgi:transcriptional regulator with XRE-family HTH domain
MDLKEIVGAEIQKRRTSKGWSKMKLAREIGSTGNGSTVCSWESGETLPGAYLLCQLADVFECSVDELLGRK